MNEYFIYFGFGSNLFSERIHRSAPSAVSLGIAKLTDYRLDFLAFSKRWNGAAATIVEDKGKHVWGCLWKIDNVHREFLDRQESVHLGVYRKLDVTVETVEGREINVICYQDTRNADEDQRPSKVYIDIIIRGALECGLPEEYIEYLKSVEHNGFVGEIDYNDRT